MKESLIYLRYIHRNCLDRFRSKTKNVKKEDFFFVYIKLNLHELFYFKRVIKEEFLFCSVCDGVLAAEETANKIRKKKYVYNLLLLGELAL